MTSASTGQGRAPAGGLGSAEGLRAEWQRWGRPFPTFMRDLDTREVPYLSHSKVATVERCPRCYFNQYVLGEQPSSTALTTGLLFHETAAAFYEARRAGQPPTAPAVAGRLHPRHDDPDEQACLDNAVATLLQNAWDGCDVVAVEELFFMDLAARLPPVIGIVDLVLRQDGAFVVVDHKTSRRFGEPDPGQLELYAEHVRRSHAAADCAGAFDEYRLVPNVKRARTPVFRRTRLPLAPSGLPALVKRYRCAWALIAAIHRERSAAPAFDCYFCNRPARDRY
jgi:hypothetical protein